MKKKNKKKIFIPKGCYCYKIIEIIDNGLKIKVKYCSYRDSNKRNKCDEPFCNKVKEYIEDDCKICLNS
jgi:hypothetical protein